MSFNPGLIAEAPLAVQVHLATAFTALTTLFIRVIDPGHLSWIHLFIPLTLFSVWRTIVSLRRGNIRGHRNSMLALYFGALIIAGGFTFIPGRLMHAVFLD
jgi:uncharacterized membrane protein